MRNQNLLSGHAAYKCSQFNGGGAPQSDIDALKFQLSVHLTLHFCGVLSIRVCFHVVSFQLAQEYLKVQTEIAYLSRHKAQLAERLSEAEGLSQLDQQDSEHHQEELRKLENEKVCKITVKLVGNTVFYFII
jgi:hypothetical protein